MYGETVKVKLPFSGLEMDVFVFCTPQTSQEEKMKKALHTLINECQMELSNIQ
jgi:hypothetical protein